MRNLIVVWWSLYAAKNGKGFGITEVESFSKSAIENAIIPFTTAT